MLVHRGSAVQGCGRARGREGQVLCRGNVHQQHGELHVCGPGLQTFEDSVWLGYVSRQNFTLALARKGSSSAEMVDICATPGATRQWSCLGCCVTWIQLKALTRLWWQDVVVGAE
eukprot:2494768-Rhodomonas_salina.3